MDVVDDDPATPEEHHTRVRLIPVRLGRRGRWDERQLSHQPDPELPAPHRMVASPLGQRHA
jgi:hypothetical protein